jgi:hypothetical protein
VDNELEGMWKEAVVAEFQVLSQNSRAGTKQSHKIPLGEVRALAMKTVSNQCTVILDM